MLASIARSIRSAATPKRSHPMLVPLLEIVGTRIMAVRDFEARLTPAIQFACDYFDEQIDAIPGPVNMSAQAFGQGALVSDLFTDAADLANAFGRSLDVKESLPNLYRSGHGTVYALLGLRCSPAVGFDGQSPVLAEHTVRCLAPREMDARRYLRLVAFTRLVKNFAEHIAKLQKKEKLLKLEWRMPNALAADDASREKDEFVYAAKELTPGKILNGLIVWLNSPALYFRIEPSDAGFPRPGQFELPCLHSVDRRQWLVCFVQLSTQEALEALRQETRTHRYILI